MPDALAHAVLKIVFHVLPPMREEFERTLRKMVQAVETSPGRLGVDVLTPLASSRNPEEWQVLIRYQTEADLGAWRASRTARTLCGRLDALTVGAPRVERIDGMETWFSLTDRRDMSPPPKWKMAIVSTVAIYPLILFVQPALVPLMRGAPRWLAILMQMSVISPLMTWIVLPTVIRLLKTWLYPSHQRTSERDQPDQGQPTTVRAVAKTASTARRN